MSKPTIDETLVEILAALEHDRWARWQKHLHSKCTYNPPHGSLTIPAPYVQALERQIVTPYAELTELEKEQDRKEARRTLVCLGFLEPTE